jgi:hypothetical protein
MWGNKFPCTHHLEIIPVGNETSKHKLRGSRNLHHLCTTKRYRLHFNYLQVRLKCSRINLSPCDGYFFSMYSRMHFWYEKSIQTPSVRTTKRHLDFLNCGCLSTFKGKFNVKIRLAQIPVRCDGLVFIEYFVRSKYWIASSDLEPSMLKLI